MLDATHQTQLQPSTATTTIQNQEQATTFEEAIKRSFVTILAASQSSLSIGSNIRDLGLDSIRSIALKHAIETSTGVEIPLSIIVEDGQTINGLANFVRDETNADRGRRQESRSDTAQAGEPVLIAPQPALLNEPFPLTDLQEAFLAGNIAAVYGDAGRAYIHLQLRLRTDIDFYRLNKALQKLIERHPMLRAVIQDDHQLIRANVPAYTAAVVDLRYDERSSTQSRYLSTFKNDQVIGTWPLFRVQTYLDTEAQAVLHFMIDEAITDAASVNIMLREWACLYADPSLELPKIDLSFRDYVLAQKKYEQTARFQRDLEYWRERLKGKLDAPKLETSAVSDGKPLERTRLRGTLSEWEWASLKSKAQQLDVSPTVLLLTVFSELLRHRSSNKSFCLVLTNFNRLPCHPHINRLVGPVASTSIFPIELIGGELFDEVIKRNQRSLWRDLDHARVSGIRALRELRAAGEAASDVILPVVFTSMLHTMDPCDVSAIGEVVQLENSTPQVFLDHQVSEENGLLQYSWDVTQTGHFASEIEFVFAEYQRAIRNGTSRGHKQ